MKWVRTKEHVPEMEQVVCVILKPHNLIKTAHRCMPWPVTQEVYWNVDTVGLITEQYGTVAYWCELPPIP